MAVKLEKEGTFAPGIVGFVRIPEADDPNKVYALGPQGRPVNDPSDLARLVNQPGKDPFSFVQEVSPEDALSVAVTGFTVDGVPGPQAVRRQEKPQQGGQQQEEKAKSQEKSQPVNPDRVQGVFRRGDDVFVVENGKNRKIELDEFKQLGVNFNFLPPDGSVVSLQEAKTGNNQIVPIPDDLPDEMKSVLNETVKALEALVEQGRTINKQIEITPKEAAKFLDQAREELQPFYSEQTQLLLDDLVREVGFVAEDMTLAQEETLRREEEAQRQIAESAAERGVAFSTQRTEAEEKQQDATERALQQIQRTASRQTGQIGRAVERTIGSDTLQKELGELQVPSLRKLAFGDVAGGTSQTLGLSGDVTGTLSRQRTVAERQRAAELEATERQRRALSFGN